MYKRYNRTYSSTNGNYECTKSFIRILHAVPNAPAVDVYANDVLIAKKLVYREFTEYLPVEPGYYRIEIFPHGVKENPVFNARIEVSPNQIYTGAAVGLLPDIGLLVIQEPYEEIPMGMAAIRVSHLSPTAPNVDVTLPNGQPLFSDVEYLETTEYLAVPPETYTLQLRVAGTNDIVLTVPNIKLNEGRYYTVYAVGLPGDEPPLEVLIPLDGLTYLPICK